MAAILLDTWLLAGLFRPVIVASGSMAPRLRGPHRVWACADCGATFACGHESLPTPRRAAVCPYCQADNDPDQGVDRPGDRVLVDRWTYAWRAPRRWEMAVLRCPESPRDWCVKRIVGLPGEHVEIRDGDVWVDGQIARKTLSEAHDMAVLVYEPPKRVQPGDDPAHRWKDPTGIWRRNGRHFVHQADNDTEHAQQTHWLEYHHPRRSATVDGPADGPILDESPYDQSESRQLNPVGDLLVRAQITCGDQGEFLFRARRGPDKFLVRLDIAAGSGTLEHNRRVVAAIAAAKIPAGRPLQLDWMLADRQLQLAINGRNLVEYPFRPRSDDSTVDNTGPGLAVGARGADIRLEQLVVLRDQYYTPSRRSLRQACRLGPEEYFLLGDNSPHSKDSRSWPRAGAPSSRIVGRVMRW